MVLMIALISGLLPVMALRKVLLFTQSLTDNAVKFTNVSDGRMHIRKIVGKMVISGAAVAGDRAHSSLDEVPTRQSATNDSRAHIASLDVQVAEQSTAVGHIGVQNDRLIMSLGRNDLVIDQDESIYVNNFDGGGTPAVENSWNLWFED